MIRFPLLLIRVLIRLGKDISSWLLDHGQNLWQEFQKKDRMNQLYLVGALMFFLFLAFPLVSYRIFNETHYIRHPHFYLAPFAIFAVGIGAWLEWRYERWLRVAGYLIFLFLFLTSLFIPLFLADTLKGYSFYFGYWLLIPAFLILSGGALLDVTRR